MLAMVALRNLWRNGRRTAISLLVIGIGVAALLLTAGFVRYSFGGLSEAIISGGLGHLEVAPRASVESASPADRAGTPPALDGWRAIRDSIEHRPHVRAAGAVTQFSGVATFGDRSAGILGMAVEPDRQARMAMITRVRNGRGLPDQPMPMGEDRVILGIGLAKALGASPGDVIVVMGATANGTLNALDLTVEGTFTSGFQDLDGRLLQVHVATAERLLATDRVSSIIVRLDDSRATGLVAGDLRAMFADGPAPLAVVDWESRAPFYQQVRGLYIGIFIFFGAIVAALVTLSISNTLLMSVLERVREFGMLMAIGTSRAQLSALMLTEALWLAVIGSLAGSALTIALAAGINAAEFEMPPPPAAVDPITLALQIESTDHAWTALFMVLILAAAAVAPIVRILRLRVIDALGHV
jgi:putative ABC transport system permease protein